VDLTVSVSESSETWQANECDDRVEQIFDAVIKASEDLNESVEYRSKCTLHGDAQFASKNDAIQSCLSSADTQGRILLGSLNKT
jgi:hypothetical protein